METTTAPCAHCGTPSPLDARFCRECGEPMHSDARVEATERRLVTVLFADLVGFTSRSERQDPEDVASFLGDYFERMRDVVTRFGGLVEKYVGDAVMAVWGARITNEDDAERAVRAGLEMLEATEKLAAEVGDPGIRLRVGVLTGEAAVRQGGNESTGMIVGDLVNSAARLQQAAVPGSVLVGDATYRAASGAIAFERAGTPELRGKNESITTWRALRVVAERGGRGRVEGLDPPFVGRRDELQLLKDLLVGTRRDRRARFLSIIGDVGIGKSRLVWELQKYADGLAEPVFWNQGRSIAYGEESITYRAMSDMLRQRIGVMETEDAEQTTVALDAALRQFVGDATERARVRPWMAALLGLAPSPEGDRSDFDAAIRSFFAWMSEQGSTVLVFEDMQWASTGLLDLVEQLTDWMPDRPLLVIALSRPELLERRPRWASGRQRVVSVRLGPLADDDMGRLVEGMLGPLQGDLRSSILERAAGIPLYAVELVRSLIAQDLVVSIEGKSAILADVVDVALPETLQSLIGARIDRLAADDRALLQDAAVLGVSFTLPGLAAVTGRPEPLLAERVGTLVGQELVEPIRDPRSPSRGGYRFVQELVRDVALRRMSRPMRRDRHIAAARYFESLGGPEHAAVAADHYLSALGAVGGESGAGDLRTQAAHVLLTALDRASTLYAHEEVLSLGKRILALDLDLPLSRQVNVEEQMSIAASALVRSDEAEVHAANAMRLSERMADVAGVRRGAALVAQVNLDVFRAERAIGVIDEQLRGAADYSTDPELARLAGLLARGRFLQGEYRAALDAADRALEAAEALQLVAVVADALVTKATTYGVLGRRIEAGLLLESVIEMAKRHDLNAIALRAYINLGAVIPQVDSGFGATKDAIDLGRRVGNLNFTLFASANLAGLLMGRAEWDEADELLGDPLWSSATGALQVTHKLLTAVGAALRGRRDEAKAALDAALEAADADSDAQRELQLVTQAAVIRLTLGDREFAHDWIRTAFDTLDSVPFIDGMARMVLLYGEPRYVDELAGKVRSTGQTTDLRLVPFLRAVAAARSSEPATIGAAEQLIDDAASKGQVVDEVVWTVGLAAHLEAGTPERTRLMSRARHRIEETGLAGLSRFLDSVPATVDPTR